MEELNDDLDALFDRAEENAVAYDWNWRSQALRLFDKSTSIGDEHLETAIASGEWDDDERQQLFERLRLNQTRPIDKKTWTKTELALWMRRIWNIK